MRSQPTALWVMNLDAEHELEVGSRYAPTRHLRTIVESARRGLWSAARPLLAEGDLVVADPSSDPRLAAGDEPLACLRIGPDGAQPERVSREALVGLAGRAWMPTPRATELLERLGAPLRFAPPPETLAAVNARAFCLAPRTALGSGCFAKHLASSMDEALELLSEPAALGWLVRRPFGAAGRGRRRMHAGAGPGAAALEHISPADRSWLVAGLRLGPLVIEPWVETTVEFTRSGLVTRVGQVLSSPPGLQETTASGAWMRTELSDTKSVSRDHDRALAEALEVAGRALHARGYVGPFGIDAFCYRDPEHPGVERLNPISEINARYTMDWALGMPSQRIGSDS